MLLLAHPDVHTLMRQHAETCSRPALGAAALQKRGLKFGNRHILLPFVWNWHCRSLCFEINSKSLLPLIWSNKLLTLMGLAGRLAPQWGTSSCLSGGGLREWIIAPRPWVLPGNCARGIMTYVCRSQEGRRMWMFSADWLIDLAMIPKFYGEVHKKASWLWMSGEAGVGRQCTFFLQPKE